MILEEHLVLRETDVRDYRYRKAIRVNRVLLSQYANLLVYILFILYVVLEI